MVAWAIGFDVVVWGGNCLYELVTPDEQAGVMASATRALRSGGYLFLDNDHVEGHPDRGWYEPSAGVGVYPTGTCADGIRSESRWEVTWHDVGRRRTRFRQGARVIGPDGDVLEDEHL